MEPEVTPLMTVVSTAMEFELDAQKTTLASPVVWAASSFGLFCVPSKWANSMCVKVAALVEPESWTVAVSRFVKVLVRLLNASTWTLPPVRMDTISSSPLPVKSPKARSMTLVAWVTLTRGKKPPELALVK